MMHDSLAELLRGADADAPPPPATDGLVDKIYRRARRRTRRRRVAAGACVLACIGALVWSMPGPRTGTSTTPAVATTVDPGELSRLRAEANMHLKVIDAVLARDRRRARTVRLIAPSVTIESEREKAALALLDHGDRLRRDLKEVDAALAAYRRTIELFPETRWAAVANQRIAQLKPGASLLQPKHSTEGVS